MAVVPISSGRVSTALSTSIVLDNVRKNQREMLREQTRLASGQKINLPSEDPFGAAMTTSLQSLLESKGQSQKNVRSANSFLSATDTALSNLNDLITEAQSLASQNVGSMATEETRAAAAQVIEALIDEVVAVGNRRFAGRYLFGGHDTDVPPFESVSGGVYYRGDTGEIVSTVDLNRTFASNVNGADVFGAVSSQVQGISDLDPRSTVATLLRDLNSGEGVRAGNVVVSDGTTTTTVDLSEADDVQDVIDLIQANGPPGMTVSINAAGDGLQLSKGGANITVTEVDGGRTARDLGIYNAVGAGPTLVGDDVNRAVSLLTPVADLYAGAGIDQVSGLIVTNGPDSQTIDLSAAVTIEDVLNTLNGAGLYVKAEINAQKDGIDVMTALSGGTLTIGENGGSTATDLGIRSMPASVGLTELNDGLGVRAVTGDDFQVQRRDGVTFDVDVSSATSVQDVLDLINTDPGNIGGLLVAQLATTGNGIELVDTSVGASDLSVTTLNASPAAPDLGIVKTVPNPGATLTGDDVRPVGQEGLIRALMDLRDALNADDSLAITHATERLEQSGNHMVATRAEIGIRVQASELIEERLGQEIIEIQRLLSEVFDVDYAEAVTNFTLLQNTFEASLRASETILNTSLLDLLG